ncbi:MAG TPA: hypothetical protein V6C85_30405 [Allocoleopsis sp.]
MFQIQQDKLTPQEFSFYSHLQPDRANFRLLYRDILMFATAPQRIVTTAVGGFSNPY